MPLLSAAALFFGITDHALAGRGRARHLTGLGRGARALTSLGRARALAGQGRGWGRARSLAARAGVTPADSLRAGAGRGHARIQP